MNIIDKAFGIHSAALTFRSQRGAVLAANIANSTTPGFQARDYDFRTALKHFSGEQSKVSIQTTNSKHIQTSATSEFGELLYRVPTRATTNDNTVEADVEQAAFSDNALRYQTSLQFLNGSISGLRKAITGKI
jgi:flagellar basal-body rod protein FlgB